MGEGHYRGYQSCERRRRLLERLIVRDGNECPDDMVMSLYKYDSCLSDFVGSGNALMFYEYDCQRQHLCSIEISVCSIEYLSVDYDLQITVAMELIKRQKIDEETCIQGTQSSIEART